MLQSWVSLQRSGVIHTKSGSPPRSSPLTSDTGSTFAQPEGSGATRERAPDRSGGRAGVEAIVAEGAAGAGGEDAGGCVLGAGAAELVTGDRGGVVTAAGVVRDEQAASAT